MTVTQLRKYLSAKGLFGTIYHEFKKIKPPQELAARKNPISLTDCLMSGLAVFSLKFPSLLKFDERREEDKIKHNLKTLFHVQQTPSDTYMRERLDEVVPESLRKAHKKIFSHVQRGKLLEEFTYLEDRYLLPGDGTGFFSSNTVHCDNCCVKHHNRCHIKFLLQLPKDLSGYMKNTYLLVQSDNDKEAWKIYYINNEKQIEEIDISIINGLNDILLNKARKELTSQDRELAIESVSVYYRSIYPDEKITYYHNMFCAAIVHPDKKIVLPFVPEPIMKTDGDTKNDCERNASKRLYADVRREHPHLRFIVVEDGLASNVPHLTDLNALDMKYIIGAKPGDHTFLFDLANKSVCEEYSNKTEDGTTHRYKYINQVQLNNSHPDFKVNFLEYWETDKKGNVQYFSWVTDIMITNDNVYDIMRGGRANWRIENNTFNTLKNQNYHFGHNFGHGNKNLSTVFGILMMLAFFVDQVQELACQLFKKARAKYKSRTSLWDEVLVMFKGFLIPNWEFLYQAIAYGYKSTIEINSS